MNHNEIDIDLTQRYIGAPMTVEPYKIAIKIIAQYSLCDFER